MKKTAILRRCGSILNQKPLRTGDRLISNVVRNGRTYRLGISVTRFATCVFFVLFTCNYSIAQQAPVHSTLEGTVTDASHLPIASASVQVVNPSTGETHAASMDSQGNFRVTGLRVGMYELHANAPGFSTYTQTSIVLAVDQTVRLTVELVPAQVKAQITVTAPPSPLDVAQTSVTSVIDHERIEELPVRTRNALDFVLLAPGVSPTSTQSASGLQTPFATSGFTFGGLRGRSNNISIDGCTKSSTQQRC
jgi:hypothetical protein